MNLTSDPLSLGQQLTHWRMKKQWTIGQLALRSGISKASLSRWEAGLVQPRVRELEATLDALEVPEVARVGVFSRIRAVRAAKRIISSPHLATSTETEINYPCGPPPQTGKLLCALRIRAGKTQREVADYLGIQQSTVNRWEASLEFPTGERLGELCNLLNATPQEIEALSQGLVIVSHGDGPLDIPQAEARHQSLLERAVFGTWQDADLTFFQLEADLWASAHTNYTLWELLMRLYATHARFLVRQGRYLEAKRYIQLLKQQNLNAALSSQGLPVPAQTWLLLEAEMNMHANHRSVRATLKHLLQQEEAVTHAEHRAWLFRILANGFARLGRTEEAHRFCERSFATPL